jgi:membrane associated rhomboid family serine protease
MIPIHDENPTKRVPWITILFILANVAVFGYELTLDAVNLEVFIGHFAFTPARFLADPGAPALLMTLFSSMFIHAGWLHLGGNMLYLWIFGNNIEDRLGRLWFIVFYLGCGVTAIAAQTLVDPASAVPLVGASGAIAGVLGGYLLLFPRARVVTIIPIFFYLELAALPAVFVIGFWFALQLVQSLGSLSQAMTGGVAWWAHVGGFVAGLIVIAPLAARDGFARSRRKRKRS